MDQRVAQRTLAFIEERHGQLLLHSGASSRNGACCLVAGPSGVGKTTLVHALTSARLAYVTDETVCLDPRTLEIEPFPKPLTVKAGSQQRLGHLEPPSDRIDPHSGNWHVDPHALLEHGAVPLPEGPLLPAVIVFPDVQPDAPSVSVEAVSRARAAFALGEESSALWAVEPRPLAALERLARIAPAYQITYAEASDAARVIVDELLGDAAGAPDVAGLGVSDEPQPAPQETAGPARAVGVDWVVLDDEAVLFDGSHLHHLDAPGAAVWQLLDGRHSEEQVAQVLAERFSAEPTQVRLDVEDLVRVLRTRGLVSTA